MLQICWKTFCSGQWRYTKSTINKLIKWKLITAQYSNFYLLNNFSNDWMMKFPGVKTSFIIFRLWVATVNSGPAQTQPPTNFDSFTLLVLTWLSVGQGGPSLINNFLPLTPGWTGYCMQALLINSIGEKPILLRNHWNTRYQ